LDEFLLRQSSAMQDVLGKIATMMEPMVHPAAQQRSRALPAGVKPPSLDNFSGNKRELLPWLNRVKAILRLGSFPMDAATVAYVAIHLTGSARQWFDMVANAVPLEHRDYAGFFTFDEFAAAMHAALGDPFPAQKAREKLASLVQKSSVSSYAAEFQRIVSNLPDRHWQDLRYDFLKGLKPYIREQIVGRISHEASWEQIRMLAYEVDELSSAINGPRESRHSHATPMDINMVSTASRFKKQPFSRHGNQDTHAYSHAVHANGHATPAAVSGSHAPERKPLTEKERAYLREHNGCFYCRELGHHTRDCQLRPSRPTSHSSKN
jgi:hypothetical protein